MENRVNRGITKQRKFLKLVSRRLKDETLTSADVELVRPILKQMIEMACTLGSPYTDGDYKKMIWLEAKLFFLNVEE